MKSLTRHKDEDLLKGQAVKNQKVGTSYLISILCECFFVFLPCLALDLVLLSSHRIVHLSLPFSFTLALVSLVISFVLFVKIGCLVQCFTFNVKEQKEIRMITWKGWHGYHRPHIRQLSLLASFPYLDLYHLGLVLNSPYVFLMCSLS